MSITVNNNIFTLETRRTAYQFMADAFGVLNHLWYGEKTDEDMSYLQDYPDVGFSPSIADAGMDRTYSLDSRLQEYPCFGTGDLRITGGRVRHASGFRSLDLRFRSYEIQEGRTPIPGLPYARPDGDCQSLIVHLTDDLLDLQVDLIYVVFEQSDIIARHAVFTSRSQHPMVIEQAASAVLDLPSEEMDLIHFPGRHAKERQLKRQRLEQGIITVESSRGTSSHHQNPGVILAQPWTDEDHGNCYGALLVYSGSYEISVEKDAMGQIRLSAGLNPRHFEWVLEPGQSFAAPEVLLSFSDAGFGRLSRNYHKLINENIVPQRFQHVPRPVLINNWEATYFDFDDEKILKIADKAAKLGIDMLVLDDGWFGQRNNDIRGLGDWFVNEEKLNGSLQHLIERIHDKGLKFGLWIEPEMVSEDSDLYRTHPEWALHIPDRGPVRGRSQLVLNLADPQVRDYLFQRFDILLSENDIDYIKWDMNRSITDWYWQSLDSTRQKELPHRYVLGLYELLDRLTSAHPEVLFEACSGGGGRFDAGMLFYQPQIWTSDNTDAHDRCDIQYGTSFFYPASTMGAHVSAVPNHQTGRTTSLEARAIAAMAGSFGYELDLNTLSEKEQEEVRRYTSWYKNLQPLIYDGDFYRLSQLKEDQSLWEFVSKDRSKAFVSGLVSATRANQLRRRVKLKGLDPQARYTCVASSFLGKVPEESYTGKALMSGGYLLPVTWGTDAPVALLFKKVQ